MTLLSGGPKTWLCAMGVVVAGVAVAPALAQVRSGQGPAASASTRESLLVTYEEGATVNVELKGTTRLPDAVGRAEVRRRPGVTEISVRLDRMRPATLFAGDFATYILWTVSPEGLAVNAGELILDGEKSELRVTSPFDMFGLFVTAEPHYLVKMPSQFVVLDNTDVGVRRGRATARPVRYQGFTGVYEFGRESLIRQPAASGVTRTDARQAIVAVALAERAGAATYAREELRAATDALARAEAAFKQGAEQGELSLLTHETVRLAVGAGEVAVVRAAEAALAAERQAARSEIDSLTEARQASEAAAARAEGERAAAEVATRQAQREQQAARALAEQSRQEAVRLEGLRAQAETAAQRARREADTARARMENALSLVADTQQTARGVIVNLPDILFESGQAVLRPQAREVLSRIAGVLLVAPRYTLSIEGHTDAVGSDAYNEELSDRRASSVRDYLAEARLNPEVMTTVGFGKTRPVATNDTPAGRQQNRRVEIVIQNDAAAAN